MIEWHLFCPAIYQPIRMSYNTNFLLHKIYFCAMIPLEETTRATASMAMASAEGSRNC
jgi:hypothetical protein